MKKEKLESLEAVAGPVSRETFERLLAFEQQFGHWSKRVNLVAPSTLPDLWQRHVLDSAQIVRLAPDARRWLDLGSGGGFPGAIVALFMTEHSMAHVDLVESNRKKAGFLQASLGALKAPATVHPRRIEECYSLVLKPDVLTSRALAPLPRLLELAEPWLRGDAFALFHKGRDYAREIEESSDAWRYDLVKHPTLADGDGMILEIRNLRRL